jgi:hypothetical protein
MRKKSLTAIVMSCTLMLAACGGDSDSGSTAANTDLVPAGEKAAQNAAEDVTPLGELVEVDAQTRFTVTGFKVNSSDSLGPWIEASVRGEANDDAGAIPFEIASLCASSTETGGWQADSTVSLGQEIPAGSFLEGFISLLLPEDGRYGEPIKPCEEPALVKVSSSEKTVWFAIPSDVVAEINSAAETLNSTLGS